MIFQSFNLFPHCPALENIMVAPVYVSRTPGSEIRERALALLVKVGLSDKIAGDHGSIWCVKGGDGES
jgi:polar amino acid transport system ATP-binding protein